MQDSFNVGTIGGIAIRVHYTWIFAVLLIAWSLALGYFPSSSQGRGAGTDWLLGIIAALLLFGSVLVHELGHSLVARARGLRVEDITLFIFGGVSSIAQEVATAWDAFVVAVVGPLTSLALAGVFWAVGQVVPPEGGREPGCTLSGYGQSAARAVQHRAGLPARRRARVARCCGVRRATWRARQSRRCGPPRGPRSALCLPAPCQAR